MPNGNVGSDYKAPFERLHYQGKEEALLHRVITFGPVLGIRIVAARFLRVRPCSLL